MSDFFTYTKFQTAADAEWLVNLLKANNISYQLTHEVNQLDNIYIGESLDPMFELKINKADFNKVTDLLSEQAITDMQAENFDHYFNSFTADDLNEVINNPNDWNAYDSQVAKTLLKERYNATPADPQNVNFVTTYTPESLSNEWITVGYISCLLTVVGIFFGLSITQAKKTLQNGEVVNIYDQPTIKHGKNMVIIGSITSAFVLISKLTG